MAILDTDLDYYLSGGAGNTDPNASLGGVISSTTVTDDTLHNLFDKVLGPESDPGEAEYRAVYFKNNHGSLTAEDSDLFIPTNTPSTDSTIDIALAGEGLNATMETIADENTAPSGESFSAPATRAAALSMGNIPFGQKYGFWIRRTINASASAYDNDSVTIRIQVDSAQ